METSRPKILVIDDDPNVCALVSETLDAGGFPCESVSTGSAATEILSTYTYPIVLCDILLPDTNGLELMIEIKKNNPDTFVILFTGHASVDLAKEAIRQGASDFITKPFSSSEILEAVRRAENEQRKTFSDITYTELKILHELTVSSRITKENREKALEHFGRKTAESFAADGLRIYLQEPGKSALEKVVDTGEDEFADEVTWYFLSSRILQSGGEALIDRDTNQNQEIPESSGSFMGTVIPTEQGSLGVILAGRISKRDRFKSRDLKLLGLYAAQLGNQLQNLRMTAELVLNNQELEKINLVTSGFASSLDISSSVSTIANGLRGFIPFDAVALFTSLENGQPYNYILRNSDISQDKVLAAMEKRISLEIGETLASENMARIRSETFHTEEEAQRDNPPEFAVVRLDDYGKINGWMVTASWQGMSHIKLSSRFIPIILRHATSALCNSLQHRDNQSNYLETITALAQTVDMKDKYTHYHSRNVTAYTLAIADKLGIVGDSRNELWNAALLHDIGKIGIPESILNKPGKLTDEEAEIIRTHPVKGCSILKPIKAFSGLLPAIRHHHEKYDGTGYPDKLAEQEIPLAARVLTVADSFDAMTSNRIYRKSPGLEFALEQLDEYSGSQFDPDLVLAFSDIIRSRPHLDILRAYGSYGSQEHVILHS